QLIYSIILLTILFYDCLFFYPATPPSELHTLSLHDALPIWNGPAAPSAPTPATTPSPGRWVSTTASSCAISSCFEVDRASHQPRSEEHTSELQSRENLVCRLLLEKKNKSIYLQNKFFIAK